MKRAAIVLLNFNDSLLINDVLKLLEKKFNWNCELIVPNFAFKKYFRQKENNTFLQKFLNRQL